MGPFGLGMTLIKAWVRDLGLDVFLRGLLNVYFLRLIRE